MLCVTVIQNDYRGGGRGEEGDVEIEPERDLSPQDIDHSGECGSEEEEEEEEEDDDEGPPPRPGRRVKFQQKDRLAVELQEHGMYQRSEYRQCDWGWVAACGTKISMVQGLWPPFISACHTMRYSSLVVELLTHLSL